MVTNSAAVSLPHCPNFCALMVFLENIACNKTANLRISCSSSPIISAVSYLRVFKKFTDDISIMVCLYFLRFTLYIYSQFSQKFLLSIMIKRSKSNTNAQNGHRCFSLVVNNMRGLIQRSYTNFEGKIRKSSVFGKILVAAAQKYYRNIPTVANANDEDLI